MRPLLAIRHFDTRIEFTILKSVISVPLEYAEEVCDKRSSVGSGTDVGRDDHIRVIQGPKYAAVRAEVWIDSLRARRDVKTFKCQHRMYAKTLEGRDCQRKQARRSEQLRQEVDHPSGWLV